MNKTNTVYILSVQAKDLYISNNLLSDKEKKDKNKKIIGYTTKNAKTNKTNIKKYINAYDYSLDLIKLREVCEKLKIKFSFFVKGKEFTQRIINVDFDYAVKQFNQVGKDIYVKFKHSYKDLVFKDNVCIVNDELIGIVLNKEVIKPCSQFILGKFFCYDRDKNTYTIKKTEPKGINSGGNDKQIPSKYSIEYLRKELYENGFYCNGIKYIRFKRSSGASREGKCLFIDERLYNKMREYDLCGLTIKENDPIDLAAFESYISLTSSSLIDTIHIKKENILVIDDYESVFTDRVIAVSGQNGELVAKEDSIEIKNSIWDGQSLIDKSLMGEKYANNGMILLRNRFFKSCCFNTNIQQFFKDNDITEISQIINKENESKYRFTLAKNIEDIKLITTPSSIKYVKLKGTLEQWFDNLESKFGIVKYEKPTPYFDGNLVQSHYQLLNTLQFDMVTMQEFLKPTVDYMKLLRDDPDVLRNHINYPETEYGDGYNIQTEKDLMFKLMGLNNEFHKTKFYDNFMRETIKSFLKNVRKGHILINGNYSTLCGNPIEMLYSSINKFDGKSMMDKESIYTTRFPFNKKLLASRSPHITMGNIWLPENKYNEMIYKYMNPTNEIVYINSIRENVLQRLNGMDFDSDALLLTNCPICISLAEKNYKNFLVPTSQVEAKKINRTYNKYQLAELDTIASVNKIGEIVNLSQELNSLLWDRLNNDSNYDYKELYHDICKLAVLSGIEIDKAKKEFAVESVDEMNRIKERYQRIKPKFFKKLATLNKCRIGKNTCFEPYDTAMDYLQTACNQAYYKFYPDKKGTVFLKLKDIVNITKYNSHEENRTQIKRILSEVEEVKKNISDYWNSENLSKTEKYFAIMHCKDELLEHCNSLKINSSTAIGLLRRADNDRFLIQILLNMININAFDYFVRQGDIKRLVESDSKGDIEFYSLNYKKIG